MKKKVLYAVLLTGIAAIVSSCAFLFSSTHKMVLDENNPAEKNVLITFSNDTSDGWFIVKQCNGKDIYNDLYPDDNIGSEDKTQLTVPAGDNSFTFDVRYTYNSRYSSTTYKVEDIELQYFLEAGKEYKIMGNTKSLGFFKGDELFVEIYDVTKDSTLLKEWKVGETS